MIEIRQYFFYYAIFKEVFLALFFAFVDSGGVNSYGIRRSS